MTPRNRFRVRVGLLALFASVIASRPASAEEYERTQVAALPPEARFVVEAETRRAQDVAVYAVDGGERFLVRYTLPSGLRAEMRVRPDGTVGTWQRAENQPLGHAAAKDLFPREEAAFRQRANQYLADMERQRVERERREAERRREEQLRREAEMRRRVRDVSEVFAARTWDQLRYDELPAGVRDGMRAELRDARRDPRDPRDARGREPLQPAVETTEFFRFTRVGGRDRFDRDEVVYAVHYDAADGHRVESVYNRDGRPVTRTDLTQRVQERWPDHGGDWRDNGDRRDGGEWWRGGGGGVDRREPVAGRDLGQGTWVLKDRLPREVREALDRETQGLGAADYYEYRDGTRRVYAARFRTDRGRRLETRVDEAGRLIETVSLDEQGRVAQPADPRDVRDPRDATRLTEADLPREVVDTVRRETRNASRVEHYLVRTAGVRPVYVTRYTTETGRRMELKVDESGRVVERRELATQ